MPENDASAARPLWEAPAPPGGWGRPWPQCVELARAMPSSQWTLVGGLMVQLHSAVAGLAVSRPTADVDIVLHIESGAATMSSVTDHLAPKMIPSIGGRKPFQVTGGTQALRRTVNCRVTVDGGETYSSASPIPSEHWYSRGPRTRRIRGTPAVIWTTRPFSWLPSRAR
jgi:hypothetical protein